jgi:hypothetical protein
MYDNPVYRSEQPLLTNGDNTLKWIASEEPTMHSQSNGAPDYSMPNSCNFFVKSW